MTPATKWLGAALLAIGLLAGARDVAAADPAAVVAAPAADPAVWGLYAQLVGTEWRGNGGDAAWRWGPDNTIVESRSFMMKTVIRAGAKPGELVSVYGGGLHTFDGRLAADGSVLWIRRGRFLKMPSRASIVDGRFVEELVKLGDANQIVKVTSSGRYEQTAGVNVGTAPPASPVASAAAQGSAAVATTAAPHTEPLAVQAAPASAAVPPPVPVAAVPAPAPAPPSAPKKGPRQLSAAELATLRARMGNDKNRRAQNLSREQSAAEQQRQQIAWQLEQSQMAAMEEEAWEDEAPSPAPNLAEVFLSTLTSEMAKNQAQRDEHDAFIRDLERQQAQADARREREQQRQRDAADQARRQQYAQQSQAPVASAQDAALQASQARAAEARERELVAQASAERARQQQLRAQQQAATPVVPKPVPAASGAAKPLRFVLSISLRNQPGDTVNPTCYSNVISRAGPPGWGAGGFLPPGSGEQARQSVYALKSAFIAQCRASGREITSDGNFNFAWNQTQGDEQRLLDLRPRHREDVSVSL